MMMKWESGVPFYKQILFWIGTTVFFMLLAILSRNKNQVIICGNGSANDSKQDSCGDEACTCCKEASK